MNPTAWLITAALVLAAVLVALATVVYRAIREGDFIIITFFGKSYVFDIPIKKESYGIHAPYIRPINEFLADFGNSNEKRIEFASGDIGSDFVSSPMLQALRGMEYERVRLRLRVISNLNPVMNLGREEGEINYTFRNPSGSFQKVKLRSLFAPKGQSILLEKL
jgi:hypothetical protein